MPVLHLTYLMRDNFFHLICKIHNQLTCNKRFPNEGTTGPPGPEIHICMSVQLSQYLLPIDDVLLTYGPL